MSDGIEDLYWHHFGPAYMALAAVLLSERPGFLSSIEHISRHDYHIAQIFSRASMSFQTLSPLQAKTLALMLASGALDGTLRGVTRSNQVVGLSINTITATSRRLMGRRAHLIGLDVDAKLEPFGARSHHALRHGRKQKIGPRPSTPPSHPQGTNSRSPDHSPLSTPTDTMPRP
jgi:hypothetical protein